MIGFLPLINGLVGLLSKQQKYNGSQNKRARALYFKRKND